MSIDAHWDTICSRIAMVSRLYAREGERERKRKSAEAIRSVEGESRGTAKLLNP